MRVAQRAEEMLDASYGRHPLTAFALERQAAAWIAGDELDAGLAAMQAADRMYSVAYPALLLTTWESVMNALLDEGRSDDVLTEIAVFLERPLAQASRDYAIALRDAALER